MKGSLLAGLLFALPGASYATSPKVEFDVGYMVACRDVTPKEFAEANPNRKIIEARFRLSSWIKQGEQGDIRQFTYSIVSPRKRLRVAEITPKTHLQSDVEGRIKVVDTTEKITTLDGTMRAAGSVPLGILEAQVSPSAGATNTRRHKVEQSFSKRAPKQLLLASGTTNHGYGVCFKLKSSDQVSLEGQRDFVCSFVVPDRWTGDYALVTCRAEAYQRCVWTRVRECGVKHAYVGLYLEGDPQARQAARRVGEAYQVYRAILQESERRDRELRALFDLVPGVSIVNCMFDPSADNEKAEARESLRAASEAMARLAGEEPGGED